MDEFPSTEILSVIVALVPGFLSAWIFYGLTAHPRKSPFERVVQALVFNLFIQGMTFTVRWGLSRIGEIDSLAPWASPWTENATLVWSVINAVVIGLLFSLFANRDWFHTAMRLVGFTKPTSYPSEWFSSLNKAPRFLTLHLKGSRRLYGWPEEWPDQSESGHFVIADPSWLLPDNSRIPLYAVDRILIPVTDVEMLEIMKSPDEVSASPDEIKAAADRLVQLQPKEAEPNGS